jgi:hypothetical protein
LNPWTRNPHEHLRLAGHRPRQRPISNGQYHATRALIRPTPRSMDGSIRRLRYPRKPSKLLPCRVSQQRTATFGALGILSVTEIARGDLLSSPRRGRRPFSGRVRLDPFPWLGQPTGPHSRATSALEQSGSHTPTRPPPRFRRYRMRLSGSLSGLFSDSRRSLNGEVPWGGTSTLSSHTYLYTSRVFSYVQRLIAQTDVLRLLYCT